jgi:fatty acid elongase 3
VSWTVITLNLFVHVIMCTSSPSLTPLTQSANLSLPLSLIDYYYYGTAGGRRFWWKQHVTTMQISQFIIDLAIVYYASFQLFSHRLHTKYTFLPATKDCAGSENAAILGCGLLSSYLFLFIQFFIATYIKGKKNAQNAKIKAKAQGNGYANGNANGIVKGMNGHANGNGVA